MLTGKSWIDLPTEITPLVYLNLLTPSTLVSIFPLAADSSDDQDLAAQEPNLDIIIGEIGIVTTGKQPWTVGQTSPIAQMLGGAIKLFRQYHRTSDPATESFDFLQGWPDRLDDDSAI